MVNILTIRKIAKETVTFFGISKIIKSNGYIIRHSQATQKKLMKKFRGLGYSVKKLDKKNIAVFPKKKRSKK